MADRSKYFGAFKLIIYVFVWIAPSWLYCLIKLEYMVTLYQTKKMFFPCFLRVVKSRIIERGYPVHTLDSQTSRVEEFHGKERNVLHQHYGKWDWRVIVSCGGMNTDFKDAGFKFEFMIRLQLYTSVFRDSVQLMYFFFCSENSRWIRHYNTARPRTALSSDST
jgi:hypothetical protein